ncbi:glycosyltransferase family 2 protein [Endozoicomonadaceae bacterium StTr2]
MKLSIVTTLYQSALHIVDFYQQISKVVKDNFNEDYEIIFVNDGSPDNSLSLAIGLAEKDSHVSVIDLSRNFGHHRAMMTGLGHAKGELVFLIDSDLEEDPRYLGLFLDEMNLKGCDVVYGIQEKRKGGVFEKVSGFFFYKLFNKLSGFDLPKNIITARLMKRDYVNALLEHREREIFIAGLWYITGFDQISYTVIKKHSSDSTYTIKKKISLFVNSVTAFSYYPLILIFYTGLIIFMSSIGYVIYILFNWAFLSDVVIGWTSVVASIWLLGGLIISFLGVIGIYLSKIFSEVKARPYTIIRKVYKQE